MNCQHCKSNSLKKAGKYKTKTAMVQRFQCKACGKTQTKRTNSPTYRLRKQKLAKKIESMYCERMSLRGIGRVLGIDRKTVNRYFIRLAHKARSTNLKNLHNREIVTSYVQFDALETFEHTKRRPLGIYLSTRAKTGELIAAKVHRTDIRALAVSQNIIKAWNANTNKEEALSEFLLETQKVFNKVSVSVGCDGERINLKVAEKLCPNAEVFVLGRNKRIDTSIRKIRNDVSRLSRKSLCSTKKAERLQNHLDLYINYHNQNRVRRQD